MKRLAAVLLVAAGLVSGGAYAQSASYPVGDGYGDYGPPGHGPGDAYYDYARVIRVAPVLEERYGMASNDQRCYESYSAGDGYYRDDRGYDDHGYPQQGGNAGRNVATIVGGVAGAVLGSKVGGGSGTYAATAIGSMVGSMAGREIYDQNQRNRRVQDASVRVCDPVPARGGYYGDYGYARANAYDVTYEYNGRQYTRRMNYHPGERVRVRVDVTPE